MACSFLSLWEIIHIILMGRASPHWENLGIRKEILSKLQSLLSKANGNILWDHPSSRAAVFPLWQKISPSPEDAQWGSEETQGTRNIQSPHAELSHFQVSVHPTTLPPGLCAVQWMTMMEDCPISHVQTLHIETKTSWRQSLQAYQTCCLPNWSSV